MADQFLSWLTIFATSFARLMAHIKPPDGGGEHWAVSLLLIETSDVDPHACPTDVITEIRQSRQPHRSRTGGRGAEERR